MKCLLVGEWADKQSFYIINVENRTVVNLHQRFALDFGQNNYGNLSRWCAVRPTGLSLRVQGLPKCVSASESVYRFFDEVYVQTFSMKYLQT